MSNDATVLAVCVNWNGEDVLPQTLASLLGSDFQRLEIVVVNHASSDGAHVPKKGTVPFSGAGDCAPAPSHTTGRTVFSIRRLESPEVRWSEEQTTSSINSCRSFLFGFRRQAGLELHPSGFTGRRPGRLRGFSPPGSVLGVHAPLTSLP